MLPALRSALLPPACGQRHDGAARGPRLPRLPAAGTCFPALSPMRRAAVLPQPRRSWLWLRLRVEGRQVVSASGFSARAWEVGGWVPVLT